MKKKIIILTMLFLFASIIFGQKTDKQESKNKLTKGGGLEIKAKLFNEKDIEKGMKLQLISSKDKSKTFSFIQKDGLKSKDKITFNGIEPGKYDVYLNITGFGVKHIKDIEIKKGKISKSKISFNKNSKCGIKGKVTIENEDKSKYERILGVVELKANDGLSQMILGNGVVDKKGRFKIIDMQPGTYKLTVVLKVKVIKNGGLITLDTIKYNVKLEENKIIEENFVNKIHKKPNQ